MAKYKTRSKQKPYENSGITRSPGSKGYPGAYQTTPDQQDRNRLHSARQIQGEEERAAIRRSKYKRLPYRPYSSQQTV